MRFARSAALARTVMVLGLGLMAGAVLHAPLRAQGGGRDTTRKRDTTIVIPVPPRPDSLLKDSLARADSLHRLDSLKKVPRDTIKAPIAHAELPPALGIARRWYWNRDSVLATGAITLADLLERLPGLTGLHAGWIAAPAMESYMGDVRRLRVFYDGFELAAMDPRTNGALDATQINLWSVEDALIEQAGDEVRVYLRSWRVRNTTPETRTDVSTGDQQTNLYRGFFGERLDNGLALQFAAQQYGTTPPSFLGSSSDQTGVVGRLGWARGAFSVDAFLSRIGRHRGTIVGITPTGDPLDSIPGIASTRTDTYLRLGVGDPDTSSTWAQLMVVGSKFDYSGIRTLVINNPMTPEDSALSKTSLDTTLFRTQYVATAGATRGLLRVSGTGRFFAQAGKHIVVPSARASFITSRLGVSAFIEGKGVDSMTHGDVTAQFTPLSFVSVIGSVGRSADSRVADSSVTTNFVQGEVGLRIHNLWLLGGILRRDSIRLTAPRVFDTNFVNVSEPAATGVTAAVRGQLWRLINADLSAVRWNDSSGFYRPRYQTRSELYVRGNFLHRFPTNDFGLMASVIHEYRSSVNYPTAAGVVTASGYRTISTLLEIRILSATISWQFRNLLGERYNQVPTFLMPRQTNFYGVRWSFSG
ncbi:MAG TPA: hypothetical protein VN651_03375 [Gemmatimonadaceae bacterium]|nr:hypothetical protein [Gemmatimonadaceae bacterium]